MTDFTMTSPAGGELPSGITAVGGIVVDIIGANGTRIVAQLSSAGLPNNLSTGFSPSAGNPATIGVLGGFSPEVLASLGGGIAQMAVRMTIYDGDTSIGDVDSFQNFLTINGQQDTTPGNPNDNDDYDFSGMTDIRSQSTSQDGTLIGEARGFQNDQLSTAWMVNNDPAQLQRIYESLQNTNQLTFGLRDTDPFDNGYDFSRGISGNYFDVSENTAPTAGDDAYTISRNGTLTVDAANGLLANDTDPEGNNLAITVLQGPQHGTLTIDADGSFTYVPNPGYSGPDSFTYRTSDGFLHDDATVNLVVEPNVAPVAGDDAYVLLRNGSLTVDALGGVLANDSDPDGSHNNLTATILTQPANGTVTLNEDGSFTYTPNPGFYGEDSFTYLAGDGDDATPATVRFTVVNPNGLPDAVQDSYAVDKNGTLTIDAANGVLANDTDPNGDPLTAEVVRGPLNGTLTLNEDGSFTYIPNPGFSGTDSFTYRANDGQDSDVTTVILTVNNVNAVPVPTADSYSVDENGTLVIDAANGVLANDTDADGTTLTASLRSSPSNGTLVLNADGSFSYVPNSGFHGTDSFTYWADDGTDRRFTTVTLVVNNVNEAPVGVDDTYSVERNGSLTVNAANGVLANDSDPDGDNLFATLQTGPRNGTFIFNVDGSFSYVPDAGFIGTDTFTYLVNDGTVTRPVTVTINVTPPPAEHIVLDDNNNVASYSSRARAVFVEALGGNDDITGSRFDDILEGGNGNDTLIGADGNDRLVGGTGNDRLFGGNGDDTLIGGIGNDLLHAGAGVNSLIGGVGDDTYYVDNTTTTVTELAGEGFDIVNASVSYVMGANIEALYLDGSGDTNGTGNELDNAIRGSNGANIIDGGAGNDTLNGGAGNDTIIGGQGNDRLIGGTGDDTLTGGVGDDTYYIDSERDVIIENAGEGYDIVNTTVDYIFGDNIEAAYLEGTGHIQAIGNSLNNYISGNSGDNYIEGGDGDDRLNGELGSDVIRGGNGNDVIYGGSSNDTSGNTLFGDAGNDQLYGQRGSDELIGGAGADRLEGGAGDDSFTFLRHHFSNDVASMDHIVDFRGAGTSGTGEQDVLRFQGFAPGTTIEFDHYGYNQATQYYRIFDPNNPDDVMMVLVQMSGTNNQLTADDYVFI